MDGGHTMHFFGHTMMEVAKEMPDKTNVSYYSENWISLLYSISSL